MPDNIHRQTLFITNSDPPCSVAETIQYNIMNQAENSFDSVEILLVEDNPDDAELAQRALKRNGATQNIFLVKDGARALDFIFATGEFESRDINVHPRVILLDLKLPLVDGLEVLGKIKSDERTRLIPVVMLTSSQEERDIIESYRLGVNSFIVKPVDFNDYMKAISEVGQYWLTLNHPLH